MAWAGWLLVASDLHPARAPPRPIDRVLRRRRGVRHLRGRARGARLPRARGGRCSSWSCSEGGSCGRRRARPRPASLSSIWWWPASPVPPSALRCLLPGTQIGGVSLRNFRGGQVTLGGPSSAAQALPLHNLIHVLFQGFDGLPVTGTPWFADRFIYIDTVAYVGVIAVVLAVLALAKRWREPEVLTFGVITVVMAALVFASPLVSVSGPPPVPSRGRPVVPGRRADGTRPRRAGRRGNRCPRPFGHESRCAEMARGRASPSRASCSSALWLFGRGHLPRVEATFRAKSFIWPVVATVVGLGVVVWLTWADRRDGRRPTRRRRVAGAGAWAAMALWCARRRSSSSRACRCGGRARRDSPRRRPCVALKHAVGSAVVAEGTTGCDSQAITSDVNAAFGVHQLTAYDPVIPRAYFLNWRSITGQQAGPAGNFIYCPAVTTATLGPPVRRRVRPRARTGPRGPRAASSTGRSATKTCTASPGSAVATLTALTGAGGLPGPDAAGTPVARQPSRPVQLEARHPLDEAGRPAPPAHRPARVARPRSTVDPSRSSPSRGS